MPTAIETSTALYLYGTEPSMTAAASQAAQRRERVPSPEWLNLIRGRQHFITGDFPTLPLESGSITDVLGHVQAISTAAEESIPEEPATRADVVVAQLIRLEQFDANWDGSGAAKPLSFSTKEAREFIRSLAPESVIPRPTLHADGHAILFLREADLYAELEFVGDKRIDFYARRGGQEWSDEFDFDGHTLPEGLSKVGLVI